MKCLIKLKQFQAILGSSLICSTKFNQKIIHCSFCGQLIYLSFFLDKILFNFVLSGISPILVVTVVPKVLHICSLQLQEQELEGGLRLNSSIVQKPLQREVVRPLYGFYLNVPSHAAVWKGIVQSNSQMCPLNSCGITSKNI